MANLPAVSFYCTQSFGGSTSTWELTYRLETYPTPAELLTVWEDFQTDVLSAVNAIQPEEVVNIKLKVQNRGTNTDMWEGNLEGGGTYAAATEEVMPSPFTWYFKLLTGPTTVFATQAPCTDAPIRRGALYLPGATDIWLSGGSYTVPVTLATEYSTLIGVLSDGFTSITQTFIPVVLAQPIPATSEHAAYEQRVADVTGSYYKSITRFKKRVP